MVYEIVTTLNVTLTALNPVKVFFIQVHTTVAFFTIVQELYVDCGLTICDSLPPLGLYIQRYCLFASNIYTHTLANRELTYFKEAISRCISPIIPISRGLEIIGMRTGPCLLSIV